MGRKSIRTIETQVLDKDIFHLEYLEEPDRITISYPSAKTARIITKTFARTEKERALKFLRAIQDSLMQVGAVSMVSRGKSLKQALRVDLFMEQCFGERRTFLDENGKIRSAWCQDLDKIERLTQQLRDIEAAEAKSR